MQHKSVLLNEVVSYLNPQAGEVYVDATFGAGGYSRAILQADDVSVIGFDQDPDVVKIADEFKKNFKNKFHFVADNFVNLKKHIEELGFKKIDGIVFDLGVSSMQLDQAERGFSFSKEADLDMRMSQEGLDAKDVVNNLSEQELADIIYKYGEEKLSRKIARKIVAARTEQEIIKTSQLSEIIHKVKPPKFHDKIDPATKTFQALRIYINDELRVLEDALAALSSILAPKARLVVVSFHSLEDRIVKQFLKSKSKSAGKTVSRYLPNDDLAINQDEFFEIVTKKPITPTLKELDENPRARSAKLRAAIWHDLKEGHA